MADAKKTQTLPGAFLVKRVSPTVVILQQEMQDELSTYVCEGKHGLLDEILYRLLSAIADQPHDPVVDAAPELLEALELIAAQSSGIVGSTSRADCMAAVASAAILKATGGAS